MKTAIYIEGGSTQLVLTPETPWEIAALTGLKEEVKVSIRRGSFYECHGGYTRKGSQDDSVIFRFEA